MHTLQRDTPTQSLLAMEESARLDGRSTGFDANARGATGALEPFFSCLLYRTDVNPKDEPHIFYRDEILDETCQMKTGLTVIQRK